MSRADIPLMPSSVGCWYLTVQTLRFFFFLFGFYLPYYNPPQVLPKAVFRQKWVTSYVLAQKHAAVKFLGIKKRVYPLLIGEKP